MQFNKNITENKDNKIKKNINFPLVLKLLFLDSIRKV